MATVPDTTAQPDADSPGVGRPSIMLARTPSGKYTWQVRVYAVDDTSEALNAARDLATKLDDEFTERYRR